MNPQPESQRGEAAVTVTDADHALLHAILGEYNTCRGFDAEGKPVYSAQEAVELIVHNRQAAVAEETKAVKELTTEKHMLLDALNLTNDLSEKRWFRITSLERKIVELEAQLAAQSALVADLRKANEGMSAACAKSDAEIDRLAGLLLPEAVGLLTTAKCPECDGSGVGVRPVCCGRPGSECCGSPDPEQYQCDWCGRRSGLIAQQNPAP